MTVRTAHFIKLVELKGSWFWTCSCGESSSRSWSNKTHADYFGNQHRKKKR